jgi:MFS family permease
VSDEAILIVVLLGGIAAMIVVLVRHQRHKEARLAARTTIEIPIQSTLRSTLILLPSMVAGPIGVAVVGALTDPWGRRHALAATLTAIGLGVVGLFAGWRVCRRYARIGLLRYEPSRLDLQLGSKRWHVDLDQPYELDEAFGFGPVNMPLQVLVVRQGDHELAFSYALPLGRKPYGERTVDRYFEPLVDGEARVIHDRLRR